MFRLADFYNADMLALAEILLHHANGALRYIRRLDFSLSGLETQGGGGGGSRGGGGGGDSATGGVPGLSSHGALTLSKVLQMSKYIEEVNLQRNNIGPFGASAIFLACLEHNPDSRVTKINMRRCHVGGRGALVLAELLLLGVRSAGSSNSSSSTTTVDKEKDKISNVVVRPLALREIDLSANYIGVQGCGYYYSDNKQLSTNFHQFGRQFGVFRNYQWHDTWSRFTLVTCGSLPYASKSQGQGFVPCHFLCCLFSVIGNLVHFIHTLSFLLFHATNQIYFSCT